MDSFAIVYDTLKCILHNIIAMLSNDADEVQLLECFTAFSGAVGLNIFYS